MRGSARDRAMTLGFAALAFVVALSQRPGWATTDTKIDLHVDPVRFLADVAAAWTPTTDLGDVHSAQYSGYLWPMGPFYAALRELGLAPWVVQRLWLGLLLALAAWGMLRLLDVLAGRPRGVAHLVATGFYVFNPYTVFNTGRATSALIAYAALPWLLIVVHRGVRAVHGFRGWRGWWWAGAFALILTSMRGRDQRGGGGLDARGSAGAAALRTGHRRGALARRGRLPGAHGHPRRARVAVVDRPAVRPRPLRHRLPAVHRAAEVDLGHQQRERVAAADGLLDLVSRDTATASRGRCSTTAPRCSTTRSWSGPRCCCPRSRWPDSCGRGAFATARSCCCCGRRRVHHGRRLPGRDAGAKAMEWIYREAWLVRFMRTTQKAAPLVAVGVAGLLGLAAQLAWARLRELRSGRGRTAALVAAPAALAALIVLARCRWCAARRSTASSTGSGSPRPGRTPARARPRAARELARAAAARLGLLLLQVGRNGRLDPAAAHRAAGGRALRDPALRPARGRALTAVDSLVQQRRLVPGQLPPLLA